MTSAPNPNFPPPPPRKPLPPWAPIIITIVSSIVLGMGSCFGFLVTLNNKNLSMAFTWLFFACVAGFVGGMIWAIVRGVTNSRRR
jgi:ABC-type uncharacterized transport system permease subunit